METASEHEQNIEQWGKHKEKVLSSLWKVYIFSCWIAVYDIIWYQAMWYLICDMISNTYLSFPSGEKWNNPKRSIEWLSYGVYRGRKTPLKRSKSHVFRLVYMCFVIVLAYLFINYVEIIIYFLLYNVLYYTIHNLKSNLFSSQVCLHHLQCTEMRNHDF